MPGPYCTNKSFYSAGYDIFTGQVSGFKEALSLFIRLIIVVCLKRCDTFYPKFVMRTLQFGIWNRVTIYKVHLVEQALRPRKVQKEAATEPGT